MAYNNGNYPGNDYYDGGPNGGYRGPNRGNAPLVLGIIAIIFSWFGIFSFISIILAIIGLFLAIRARNSMPPGTTGRATVGLVLCLLALAISFFGLISCFFCYNYGYGNYYDYYYWW